MAGRAGRDGREGLLGENDLATTTFHQTFRHETFYDASLKLRHRTSSRAERCQNLPAPLTIAPLERRLLRTDACGAEGRVRLGVTADVPLA